MDAFQLDILRRLDDLQNRVDCLDQRARSITLVLQQMRRDAIAQARAPVPPPAPEPPPAPTGSVVRLLDGGWPGVARLAILASPFLAAVLLWLSWATSTPLPSLILAIFGSVPHADPSTSP